MPRLLAIEQSGGEVRLAVGSSFGGDVTIEHAFSVFSETEAEGTVSSPKQLGQRVGSALAAKGIGRPDTLVLVGRSQVELRQLAVPPSPDEELPELVCFQALQEFSELGEDWPLDFVVLQQEPDKPRRVLAAAINPELVDRTREMCEAAGIRPCGMILRPCAAASLLRRRSAKLGRLLLVDMAGREAELTVMIDGRETFLRSARFSGDPFYDSEARKMLLSEIQRTIAAARNQLGGQHVDAIVLCGAGDELTTIAEQVQERLARPTETFDPFDGLRRQGDLARRLPEQPGRYAALLGTLLDELENAEHAIDFLRPRRRVVSTAPRKPYVLAAVAATILLLLGLGYGWLTAHLLKREIAGLEATRAELVKPQDEAKQNSQNAEAIGNWMAADIVWLDELHRLCKQFPPAEQAMLHRLTLTLRSLSAGRTDVQGLARIELQGLARDVETVKSMERDLSDRSHRVVGKDKREDRSQKPYAMEFDSRVMIRPEHP